MNKNIIRMNKKGNLLAKETLKIVLAVISISFLVFFLVSLYYSYSRNKDLELAEASLKHLVEQINAGAEETEIYNPINWEIVTFPISPEKQGVLPEICKVQGWENCICICKSKKTAGLITSGMCDDEGTCLDNSFAIGGKKFMGVEAVSIPIQNLPLILTINYTDKTISKKQT